CFIDLLRMVVGGRAIGQPRAPREEVRTDRAVRRRALARDAARAYAIEMLIGDGLDRVVRLEGAAKIPLRRARVPSFRRDEDGAGGSCARAVNGGSGSAFEDLHRLDVVRIDIRG